ncbi:MAG TPA: tetraacyldisaccharide 4'-kinase [Burkholderiaceae bacterium]|jgi:tetraacyldisaccharide 4'-kinase|nr:tetraacyldisaccharide 4'-kinase [Burkholderiaceae bacterium]
MRAWMRRGPLACVLWPVSLLFRLLALLRRSLYHAGLLPTTRLPVPVIVVGNVLVGGTGKTPFVIWLIDALQRAGYVPGVVSRGYGARTDAPQLVTAASAARDVGDEPLLIAGRTGVPVMVGRDRAAAAVALLRRYPHLDVVVSDDGLQHYALGRDLEIVLFDARGAGNGWLLPAGPLREPATRRCDFTVVNAAQVPPGLPRHAIRMRLAGEFAERLSDPSQRLPLAALRPASGSGSRYEKIVAAAGIGNPSRFFEMLRGAGLVFEAMPLPDHYRFDDDPFAGLQADIILVTEKDAVKCRQIEIFNDDPRLWVVPVTAHLDGALAEQILEKLRGHPTA